MINFDRDEIESYSKIFGKIVIEFLNNELIADLHIRSNQPVWFRYNEAMKPTDKFGILSYDIVHKILFSIIYNKYNINDSDDDLIKTTNVFMHLINNKEELDFSIEMIANGVVGSHLYRKYPNEKIYRARVNAFWSNGGLGFTMRKIKDRAWLLEELNIYPENLNLLKSVLNVKEGLVLITGQTGSGKTSTLSAIIDYINTNYEKHIVTIEDPIEYIHTPKRSLITHREVGKYADTKDFLTGLRASLREDPDVILLGEIRDVETAVTAIQAAQTGHLVLGTLHTNNAEETIMRLLDMIPLEKLKTFRQSFAFALKAILSQRLVPSVTGRRILAYELMVNDITIKNLILSPEYNSARVRDAILAGRHMGMIRLNDCLLRRINEKDENFKISPDKALEFTYDSEELEKLIRSTNGENFFNKKNVITGFSSSKWD